MNAETPHPYTAAIIVAAGRGERAGVGLPKQYRPFAGVGSPTHTVLSETVHRFLSQANVNLVQVVIHADDRDLYDASLSELAQELTSKLRPPVIGGATRQASVLSGLTALSADTPQIDHILIHDAARPFVSDALIQELCQTMSTGEVSGVVPTRPMTDTVKQIEGQLITGTIPRETLACAQTPQIFRFTELLAAHQHAETTSHQATDDAALLEALGARIATITGPTENIKLTYEADFMTQPLNQPSPRTGSGFDVHRLAPGTNGLTLCGVHIPGALELVGHSDADVGLHALTDALLGLIALDDIGAHFPPSDETHRNQNSAEFVAFAMQQLAAHQAQLTHIDITLICEKPKISAFRPQMRARVAELVGLPESCVSIKATTTEGLGFTGRGEGIAAQALASAWIR